MKKLLTKTLLVLTFFMGLVVSATAAPIVTIESISIAPGTTNFDLDVNLFTDLSSPIDSAAFQLSLPSGVTFTSASFAPLPSNWIPTSSTATNRFGATDFGFPANEITSSQLFATLFFSLSPALSVAGNIFNIGFAEAELTNSLGTIYQSVTLNPGQVNVVPIPAAAWLLGSGLVGLVLLKRRKRA
jgi:hypothetical protein